MNRVDGKAHHITTFGWYRHRVCQPVLVRGQVRCTGPVCILGDVLARTGFVRPRQEANFAVVMVRIVQVDQHVNEALIVMGVERPVLVHRKRVSSLRRLHMHRRVVQLDIGAQQVGHGADQARVGHRAQPGIGVEGQVVHRHQLGGLLRSFVHVLLAPIAAPAWRTARPVFDQPVQLLRQLCCLIGREHLWNVQETIFLESHDLVRTKHCARSPGFYANTTNAV